MKILPLLSMTLLVCLALSRGNAEDRVDWPPRPVDWQIANGILPVETIGDYEILLRFTSDNIPDSTGDLTSMRLRGKFECFYYSESSPVDGENAVQSIKIEDLRWMGNNYPGIPIQCTLADSGKFNEVYRNRFAGPVYRIEPIILPPDLDSLELEYKAVLHDPSDDGRLSWKPCVQRLLAYHLDCNSSLIYWIESMSYPNPFCPITKIAFDVYVTSQVTLIVYNAEGQIVDTLVDDIRAPGAHKVDWPATGLPSGIYFYKLTIGDSTATKKMLLMK